MTTEIRDPQFALFVDELADSLALPNLSFAFGAIEAIAAAAVSVYDAFATPEPGVVSLAVKGLVV